MKILITAGPTREALDPVRYLSNRSSGKMGYAVAQAAAKKGHEVLLISGPVNLPAPEGVALQKVTSAQDMYDAVQTGICGCEIAIYAAAVADYRPVQVAAQKMKKQAERVVLELEKTQDILGSARSVFGYTGVLVGFAAETQDLELHASDKMMRKGCDLLIGNRVDLPGIGFDSDDNEITLFRPGEPPSAPIRGSKHELAQHIIHLAETLALQKLANPS